MKNALRPITTGTLACAAFPTIVLAAEGRADDSHLLTYGFLAFCGVIILLQLVPVISLMKDLFKGSMAQQDSANIEELETVTSKYQ